MPRDDMFFRKDNVKFKKAKDITFEDFSFDELLGQ